MKKAAKKTTALAVRKKAHVSKALVRRPWVEVMATDRQLDTAIETINKAVQVLSDEVPTNAIGLVEIKLTKKEELVLAREVRVSDVSIKPSGQPYLSHPVYTRWFNDAFGRLGWSLVAQSKPKQLANAVVVPYLLYVHGKPVAFAWGEQEYHEKNREQTYGDALEATNASALRRCAKRIGVGLELWNKQWLGTFIAAHTVRVKVQRKDDRGYAKRLWRLKTDAPFYDEIGASPVSVDDETGEVVERGSRSNPRPPASAKPKIPITQVGRDGTGRGQVGRLFAIIKNAGRSHDEVKKWLISRYGIEHTRDITQDIYDDICAAIEKPGELGPGSAREPGAEG
jgi:hypothetical protein